MVVINVSSADSREITVDRDGIALLGSTRQGFEIWLCGVKIHFEDEADAAEVARAVLQRLGELKE